MLQTARYLNFLVFIHFRMKFFGNNRGKAKKNDKKSQKMSKYNFPQNLLFSLCEKETNCKSQSVLFPQHF